MEYSLEKVKVEISNILSIGVEMIESEMRLFDYPIYPFMIYRIVDLLKKESKEVLWMDYEHRSLEVIRDHLDKEFNDLYTSLCNMRSTAKKNDDGSTLLLCKIFIEVNLDHLHKIFIKYLM